MLYSSPSQQLEKLTKQTLSYYEYGETVIELLDGNSTTERNINTAISIYSKLEEIRNNILVPMFEFCSKLANLCYKNKLNMVGIGLVNEYIYKFKKISENLKKHIEFLETVQLDMTDDPLRFVKNNPNYLKNHDIYECFFGFPKEYFEKIIKDRLNIREVYQSISDNRCSQYTDVYNIIITFFLKLHPLLEVNFYN